MPCFGFRASLNDLSENFFSRVSIPGIDKDLSENCSGSQSLLDRGSLLLNNLNGELSSFARLTDDDTHFGSPKCTFGVQVISYRIRAKVRECVAESAESDHLLDRSVIAAAAHNHPCKWTR